MIPLKLPTYQTSEPRGYRSMYNKKSGRPEGRPLLCRETLVDLAL